MKIRNRCGGHIIANQRKNYLLTDDDLVLEDAFYFECLEDISVERKKEYLKELRRLKQ